MIFKSIILRRFRNAAHFQFHTEFKKLVERLTPEALKIEALFATYLLLYNKMDEAYKKIVKSSITAQLQDADKARDEIVIGLRETISGATRHPDPQVRESAKRLKIVFSTYGNIATKPLDEETAAITNILQDLEGKYAANVAKVGVLPWIVELKARNIAFSNLVSDRDQENSQKNLTVLKEARAELDEVFYAIIRRISAFVEIEGIAAYEPLVLEVNVYIDRYNNIINARLGRGKKGNEAEEEEEELEDAQTQGGSDD